MFVALPFKISSIAVVLESARKSFFAFFSAESTIFPIVLFSVYVFCSISLYSYSVFAIASFSFATLSNIRSISFTASPDCSDITCFIFLKSAILRAFLRRFTSDAVSVLHSLRRSTIMPTTSFDMLLAISIKFSVDLSRNSSVRSSFIRLFPFGYPTVIFLVICRFSRNPLLFKFCCFRCVRFHVNLPMPVGILSG